MRHVISCHVIAAGANPDLFDDYRAFSALTCIDPNAIAAIDIGKIQVAIGLAMYNCLQICKFNSPWNVNTINNIGITYDTQRMYIIQKQKYVGNNYISKIL